MDSLRDRVVELVAAYENDATVFGLAERAGAIRFHAAQLEDVLNGFGNALQGLTG